MAISNAVLLINMPFNSKELPPLGISLLKACLEKSDIPCDIYHANLHFAKIIGKKIYNNIGLKGGKGDIVFADYMWGKRLKYTLNQYPDKEIINTIKYCQSFVPDFFKYSFDYIDWTKYAIIGFTIQDGQTLASLGFAKKIKEKFLNKLVVFGGANCRDIQGVSLLKLFPFINLVFQGESELIFPEVVKRYCTNKDISNIKYATFIREKNSTTTFNGICKQNIKIKMNDLPYPNFDDWIKQTKLLDNKKSKLRLTMETSRGCWWGKCSFCVDCSGKANFRSKSSDRVYNEMKWLIERYHPYRITFTDSITSTKFFNDLYPKIANEKKWPYMLCAFRADLTKNQLNILKKMNNKKFQAGIGLETFNIKTFDLMDKGCNVLQNIQVLKWCTELKIHIRWFFLYGTVNLDISSYNEMFKIVEKIYHLHPPEDISPIRLPRFSLLYMNNSKYNINSLEPEEDYKFVYPFSPQKLKDLIYNYYSPEATPKNEIIGKLLSMKISIWNLIWEKYPRNILLMKDFKFFIFIIDERPIKVRKFHLLTKYSRTIYKLCDSKHSIQEIRQKMNISNNGNNSDIIKRKIEILCDLNLMININNEYLSLAIKPNIIYLRILFLLLPEIIKKFIIYSKNKIRK